MKRLSKLFCVMLLCVAAGRVLAAADDEAELAKIYGNEEFVSIATGQRQPLSRAPAIASVVSARDIETMGATDIDQALESIPGLHVSTSPVYYNPIYVIRGAYSKLNPQVLMLVNGISVTNLNVGDRGVVWGGMPVKDIARIEVIRGPGSALYGADAFAGTINIITKTAEDIRGTESGVRAGSFNTRDAWLLHGGKWGELDAAFSVELHSTDGQRELITRDAGSASSIGATLAPGPVNTRRDTLDTRLDLARGDWRLRMGYQGRFDVGTGAGAADALDPKGDGSSDRFNADITYHNPVFSKDWDVKMQMSYFDVNRISHFVLYPPGAYAGAFPQGMIGNPQVFERHARAEGSAVYSGLADHSLRIGAGFYFGNLYKVRETKNFSSPSTPLGGIVDVSESAPFIRRANRKVWFAYAQDEWSFAPDWTLTAGVRDDRYSDFGNTLNPRLALVWQARQNLTTKLLYGSAFRAPSFAEQYNINNPVALGNPGVKPETVDTTELALDYQASQALHTRLSLFRYKMQDIIRFVADPAPATTATAKNTGSQTGYGLEWEAAWDVTNTWRLSGNYAYQRSTDDATNTDAGNAPHHHIFAHADWRFQPGWSLGTQVNRVADRRRTTGDSRPAVPDYTTVDMTLRRMSKGEPWNMALSVFNLFNVDAREPTVSPGRIPNDLPLAKRNFMLEVGYDF